LAGVLLAAGVFLKGVALGVGVDLGAVAAFFVGVFLAGVAFLAAGEALALDALAVATTGVSTVALIAVAEGASGAFLGGAIEIGSLAGRFLETGVFLAFGVEIGVGA
jgi:hypothetical protein